MYNIISSFTIKTLAVLQKILVINVRTVSWFKCYLLELLSPVERTLDLSK